MEPNLKRGKSAVVLAVRGAGSRKARQEAFEDNPQTLEVPMPDGETLEVYMEAQYTHLGTVLHREASMEPEARRRGAIAATAYRRYGKLVLQNPDVDLDIRRGMFISLVQSSYFNLVSFGHRPARGGAG